MILSGWPCRARDAALAGLIGWGGGFIVTIPFEVGLAKRYASGGPNLLPVLAQGLFVWGCFTLFMALAGWIPIILPMAVLVPSRWIMRLRWLVIPGSPLIAFLAMGWRLRLFQKVNFADWGKARSVFFTAPNLFAWSFALIFAIVYANLAARRLSEE